MTVMEISRPVKHYRVGAYGQKVHLGDSPEMLRKPTFTANLNKGSGAYAV